MWFHLRRCDDAFELKFGIDASLILACIQVLNLAVQHTNIIHIA